MVRRVHAVVCVDWRSLGTLWKVDSQGRHIRISYGKRIYAIVGVGISDIFSMESLPRHAFSKLSIQDLGRKTGGYTFFRNHLGAF